MAKEKRMISNSIYDQDEFLDMPHSAIVLYTYLNLAADDEGFVGNTKSVMRKVRASEDDLKILLAKRFVLAFEHGSSIVVIKHWLIHNSIRQERIKDTTYQKEKATLKLNEFGAYTESKDGLFSDEELDVRQLSDNCQPSISNLIYTDLIKLIIDYLNNKLNTKYKYTNTTTNSHIKARLDEGFTVEDFYLVIDTKFNEWINDDKMRNYLRPITLFRPSNFESYLNQSRLNIKKTYGNSEPDWMDDYVKRIAEMEN
ncbi:MAG: conserved phage C-terminal domain-containing protein [Acholeplasmataceae bacterium]